MIAPQSIPLTRYFERIQTYCTSLHDLSEAAYRQLGVSSESRRPQVSSVFSKAVKWVMYARRPLFVRELLEAISLDDLFTENFGRKTCPHHKAGRLLSTLDVINDCWGCLKINTDDVVQIKSSAIHEILTKLGSRTYSWMVHEEIAKACLNIIIIEEQEIVIPRNRILWEYSLRFWHDHCRAAEVKSQDVPRLLHERLQADFCRMHKHGSQICGQISSEDLATALHFAVKYGLKVLAKTYLEMGADANAQSPPLSVASLHLAVANKNLEIAQLLLKRGAENDVKDLFGRSPLHYAAGADSLSCLKLLLDNGADLNPKAYSMWTDRMTCDLDYGNMGWGDIMLQSELYWFANRSDDGNYDKANQCHEISSLCSARGDFGLLRSKLSNYHPDKLGKISLDSDCANYLGLVLGFLAVVAPEGYLNRQTKPPGIDLGMLTCGVTPLQLAVCANRLQAVMLLLKAGADVNIRTTSKDMTALDIARILGHNQVAEYLERHSALLAPCTSTLYLHSLTNNAGRSNQSDPCLNAISTTSGSAYMKSSDELERTSEQSPSRCESMSRVASWLCSDEDLPKSSGQAFACSTCLQYFRGTKRAASPPRGLDSDQSNANIPCEVLGCSRAFSRRDRLRHRIRRKVS